MTEKRQKKVFIVHNCGACLRRRFTAHVFSTDAGTTFSFIIIILAYLMIEYTVFVFEDCYCNVSKEIQFKNSGNVEGCDTGFGNLLAQRLDSLGVTVYAGCLFADGPLAKELKQKTSERLHIVQLDVTKQNEVDDAVKYVKETLKDKVLWSVINNAGIMNLGELEWFTIEKVNKMMDINLYGQIRMTNTFLPLLRESKGRVVNVISIAGHTIAPGFGPYCCSKYASVAYTNTLRTEMKKMSISVHSVEPVIFATPLLNTSGGNTAWDDSPSEIKKVYGNDYNDILQNKIQRLFKIFARPESEFHLVVDCLVDASIGTNPKTRYVPGFSGQILTEVVEYLPRWLLDIVAVYGTQPLSILEILRGGR